MFKISKYIVTSEIPDEQMDKIIIYSLRTGASFVVKKIKWDALLSNSYNVLSDNELILFIENKILILVDENEIDQILLFNKGNNSKTDSLTFTIQPTSNCQLGCFYCGQEHKKDKISDDVIQKTIERIEYLINKNKEVKNLHITWYGGEPLMASNAIEKYSLRLMDICRSKKIRYTSNIITNGLLLKDYIYKKMLEFNILSYQVTLDGTKETHDKRRITKGGKGTFDLIFKNIVSFVKSDEYKFYNAALSLRINIDKTMIDRVDDLIEMVYNEGILNNIDISFAPVFDWGGNGANKIL